MKKVIWTSSILAALLIVVAFVWMLQHDDRAERVTSPPSTAQQPVIIHPAVIIPVGPSAVEPGIPGSVGSISPPGPAKPPPPPATPPFRIIEQVLGSLPLGSMVFNVSTVMALNRSDSIHLLLSPLTSVEDLETQLQERFERTLQTDYGVQGKVEAAKIRIAERMEARLSGLNFSILALTPEIQPVTWNEPTDWRWEVRPTEAGTQLLHLSLAAILQINSVDSARAIRTFDRHIQVEVTWPQRINGFAAENWQWLWTTVAVPIAVWLWGKRRRRRRGAGFLD